MGFTGGRMRKLPNSCIPGALGVAATDAVQPLAERLEKRDNFRIVARMIRNDHAA